MNFLFFIEFSLFNNIFLAKKIEKTKTNWSYCWR